MTSGESVSTLRWGILGCARITRRGLVPGIKASRLGTLQALASRNEKTADAWAKEFEVPSAYGSYEDLLADQDVDAVYLPLPNELHKPWTFQCADAGKHILCEKPLSLDAAEAKEMAAYCASKGVLLMEAFMWRHQPRTAQLLKRVEDGAIGTLRLIRSSFSYPIEQGDWRLDPTRGAGSLWDVGCYGVSTARLFAKAEPTEIQSMARHSSQGVDMTLTASMSFPDGVIGLIDCSFEAPFRCEYELIGTTGSLLIPDAYLPPKTPTALLFGTGSDASGSAPQSLTFDGLDQYACMVDSFAQSVADGRLLPPAEDGVAQMLTLDLIKTNLVSV